MSKKQTAVSDEEIIAALMSCDTIREAASKAGISERTIYERMASRDFKSAYSAAKADVIREAVRVMNEGLVTAVDTVMEILTSDMAQDTTRLQAAKIMFDHAEKLSRRLDEAEAYTVEMSQSPLSHEISNWV